MSETKPGQNPDGAEFKAPDNKEYKEGEKREKVKIEIDSKTLALIQKIGPKTLVIEEFDQDDFSKERNLMQYGSTGSHDQATFQLVEKHTGGMASDKYVFIYQRRLSSIATRGIKGYEKGEDGKVVRGSKHEVFALIESDLITESDFEKYKDILKEYNLQPMEDVRYSMELSDRQRALNRKNAGLDESDPSSWPDDPAFWSKDRFFDPDTF